MIKLSNQALLTDLSNIEKSDIKSALTITNPKFSVAMSLGKNVMGISKYTYYFKDTQEGLVIPIGYGISLKDNYLAHHDIEDYRVESPDLLDIEFSGELREYQKGPVDFILGNTNGVIQAPTGTGKTVIAIAAICKRKQPTLILVHTLELANQFVDRLKAFTNIRDVGFIGDTRKIIKPVTVGLLQSVTKMDPTELNKTFGQIFVDEAHIIPANTFAAAIARLKAKYKWALGATPERTDGLTKIIFWLTGMNHYIVDDTDVKSSIVIPELKVIKTDYFFPIFDSSEYTQMISHLSEDDARNNLILDTYKDYKDRQVVMLCQRQSQVKWLHENIQGSRMLTSKTPKAQRKKIMKELSSGKCKAVISTIQLFSTGIDVPSLDALFICAPVKSKILVKQMAGRIMRPLANKKKPIIIDFYDDKVEILKFQFYNRNRTLKKIIGA